MPKMAKNDQKIINLSNDGKRPKRPKPKKHKNARNLVMSWNLGKGKYTIILEIGCQCVFTTVFFSVACLEEEEKKMPKMAKNGQKCPKKNQLKKRWKSADPPPQRWKISIFSQGKASLSRLSQRGAFASPPSWMGLFSLPSWQPHTRINPTHTGFMDPSYQAVEDQEEAPKIRKLFKSMFVKKRFIMGPFLFNQSIPPAQ